MKSLVVIVLMSVISCESLVNETNFSPSSPSSKSYNHKFIMPSQNESFGFHLESESQIRERFGPGSNANSKMSVRSLAESSEGENVQAQQPQSGAPTTVLSRIVETKYGKVQGLSVTLFPNYQGKNYNHPLRNKIVEVFLSIPYASPPVKSHRFSPTQTPLPWDGVRSAVKPGFVCPQVLPDIRDESAALREMPKGYLEYLRRVEPYLRNQSEDCLYLNIHSPIHSMSVGEGKPKLKPVLVFVHGGQFLWGSGNLYDGTLLSAYGDIVFVAINYRLGVLGFLNVNPSPQTKPRVANYGLMDQIAALHWLKENIMFFGGDPDMISLMGIEAGSAAIHFLMSSPAVMPGLFHRAILISGSTHAPWALVEDPAAVAAALAETLNCSISPQHYNPNLINTTQNINAQQQHTGKPSNQNDPIIDCLKNKHFSYFAKFRPPKFSVDFGPSIDGIVIRSNYKSTMEPQMGKRDLSQKYDLLFGISSLEMLTAFSEEDLAVGFEAPRRDAILRTLIRNSYRFHLNEILATITNEYIDWEKSSQHPIATRDSTLNAVTDCMSLAPVIAASDSAQVRKSFFYVFEHSTKDGLYNYQRPGAGGGEELNYFFGFSLLEQSLPFFPAPLPSNYTKSEMALSELLITHLSNFVQTGDPNEPIKPDVTWPISKEKNKFRSVLWEPYDRLHQKYLELTANKVRIRTHYRAHQMAIWLRLVPELQKSGAQYASILHNRMKGGYDPSLYVGSLRLPQELEISLEGEIAGDPFYNGTGIPPSPPTTCYSQLSSLAASGAIAGNILDGRSLSKKNKTHDFEESSAPSTSPNGTTIFSPYTTALSLTIAIGCSLLILNVFIFALVYYQRDKKRVEEMMRRKARGTLEDDGESRIGLGHHHRPSRESDTENPSGENILNSIQEDFSNPMSSASEPPELLKSNSSTTTLFHQSQSQGSGFKFPEIVVQVQQEADSLHQHNPGHGGSGHQEYYNDIPHIQPSDLVHYQSHQHSSISSTTGRPHKEVHFSPRLPNNTKTSHRQSNPEKSNNIINLHDYDQQVFGIATLPRHSQPQENTSAAPGDGNASTISSIVGINTTTSLQNPTTGTLPKKPVPPTRNFTNYSITQRQIFSLIMSLMTMGIL